jgi:hypothetical protein
MIASWNPASSLEEESTHPPEEPKKILKNGLDKSLFHMYFDYHFQLGGNI